MRIDKFLYFIRLVKSRTRAQELIEGGHVRIAGRRVAKPAEDVRVGEVIALPLRGTVRVLEVLALPARRGPPAEAALHYREIDEASAAT